MAEIIEETPVVDTLEEAEQKAVEDEDIQEDIEKSEEEAEVEAGSESESESESTEEDTYDEDIITFGDEDEQHQSQKTESPVIKDLRNRLKQKSRENTELQQKLNQFEPTTPPLGPKPTIEGCDYDAELFAKKNDEWHALKAKHDVENTRMAQVRQQQDAEWNQKLNTYQQNKQKLRVKDFGYAETTVEDIFNRDQQGIIIHASDNPAMMVYALGKNPNKSRELSAIKDPLIFAHRIGRMESNIKMSKRKPKTSPEKSVQGTGRLSGSSDQNLERLRSQKTNDISKTLEYRRKKRRAAK
jgi:hypothetical protein